MPERHHRFNAGRLELSCHFDVTADGCLVVAARLRLDARPLDAESIMVHTDFLQRFQIPVKIAPAELGVVAFGRNTVRLGEQVPIRLEVVW